MRFFFFFPRVRRYLSLAATRGQRLAEEGPPFFLFCSSYYYYWLQLPPFLRAVAESQRIKPFSLVHALQSGIADRTDVLALRRDSWNRLTYLYTYILCTYRVSRRSRCCQRSPVGGNLAAREQDGRVHKIRASRGRCKRTFKDGDLATPTQRRRRGSQSHGMMRAF